jgi:hypothetical protein
MYCFVFASLLVDVGAKQNAMAYGEKKRRKKKPWAQAQCAILDAGLLYTLQSATMVVGDDCDSACGSSRQQHPGFELPMCV